MPRAGALDRKRERYALIVDWRAQGYTLGAIGDAFGIMDCTVQGILGRGPPKG